MEIKPKQPTAKGPVETFTGDVWVDAIANGEEPSRVRVNLVRLSPRGMQRLALPRPRPDPPRHRRRRAGSVPGRRHRQDPSRRAHLHTRRRGALAWRPADDFMTHLSITEGVGNGEKPETDWGAHVTDAEYHGQAQ